MSEPREITNMDESNLVNLSLIFRRSDDLDVKYVVDTINKIVGETTFEITYICDICEKSYMLTQKKSGSCLFTFIIIR